MRMVWKGKTKRMSRLSLLSSAWGKLKIVGFLIFSPYAGELSRPLHFKTEDKYVRVSLWSRLLTISKISPCVDLARQFFSFWPNVSGIFEGFGRDFSEPSHEIWMFYILSANLFLSTSHMDQHSKILWMGIWINQWWIMWVDSILIMLKMCALHRNPQRRSPNSLLRSENLQSIALLRHRVQKCRGFLLLELQANVDLLAMKTDYWNPWFPHTFSSYSPGWADKRAYRCWTYDHWFWHKSVYLLGDDWFLTVCRNRITTLGYILSREGQCFPSMFAEMSL